MELINCPSPSLPSHPFLSHCSIQPRRNAQLFFLTKSSPKHSHNLVFLARPPTQALKNSVIVAASSPPAAAGDLSVLIPISALLLFMYWIANFIIPGMISKDLQPAASAREEGPEEEASSAEEKKESMPVASNLKIKKGRGIKKTTSPR